MADWSMWLVAAGATVILELFSGTFYLLMIAIGLAAGGAVALLAGPWIQTLTAAVVGVVATGLLHRSRYGRPEKQGDSARDPNINLDIGQTVTVPQWQDGAARVMYRGALWDVELAPGVPPAPGQFTIREIRGSRLIVAA